MEAFIYYENFYTSRCTKHYICHNTLLLEFVCSRYFLFLYHSPHALPHLLFFATAHSRSANGNVSVDYQQKQRKDRSTGGSVNKSALVFMPTCDICSLL